MSTVKLKAAPIISMLGVTALVVIAIVLIDAGFRSLPDLPLFAHGTSWMLAILVHVPQFVIPFLVICCIKQRGLGEYGFNLKENPPTFTHRRMLMLGVAFGLFMSLKYISQVVAGEPLDIPQPVTLVSVMGNLAFQWIVVGLCEETMFRGLIQTHLMNNLEGYVKVLGHDLHVGTVIGAIIWGAFHFVNLLVMPWGPAIFYVILTTVIGLAMGYAYQETRSLLTTMIVHNTIFGVPLTIGYLLHWLL
ncbi:MAG: CPBP family intramembrane metalloprotease [Ardenticatenales bacterium]|nr:CPBP family intramembrane metalloprotease [Ardenticatenales bacterium]